MSALRVTVVIPTLAADAALTDCLLSLKRQTRRDFEIVIVDNSGSGKVRRGVAIPPEAKILENTGNVGFGAAINQAFRRTGAPFLATLNDDACPHPEWLAALLQALEGRPEVGMCASQVRLSGENCLDSAGMLIGKDASSRQRGHREHPGRFKMPGETLFPSGCAALYRRQMLEEIGLFDERFFLYCEDTDLGLRALWAGWRCLYVPDAVVEHQYSRSAGRASPLKAYYVERNRLFVVAKNFPARMLFFAPAFTLARYGWHLVSILRGRGAAAEFRREGHSGFRLILFVLRAHLALAAEWPRLWRERRSIRRNARISASQFRLLIKTHSISARQVAAL